MNAKALVGLIFVFSLMVLGGPASAATITVDMNDPNCDNPGDDLYCTIQEGIDAASVGDTVQVEPGSYNEHVTLNKASIDLRGSGALQTSIVGTTGSDVTVTSGSDNCSISGFNITDDGLGYPAGILIDGAQNISIKNNSFLPMYPGNMSIFIWAINGSSVIIEANYMVDVDDVGIVIGGGSTGNILNNIIYFTSVDPTEAISFESSTGYANNNTIINGATGVSAYGTSNVEVKNNIIVDSDEATRCSGGTISVSYNNLYNNVDDFGACSDDGNNIHVDPLFVAANDYHLQGTSACIDAGDNSAAYSSTDFEGNDRIVDGDLDGTATVDMGAYEFQWTELTYDDFESGWGNYSDGGSNKDCKRYTDGTHAHQGNAAINIQDNSGVSSSFYYTNGVDVNTPGYTQIEVDFWFKAVSLENGEDFWVQYYDGSTWHTVAAYARGTDFNNNTFYNKKVYIDEANYNFPTNLKIRFMNDASGNRDDVYIDEIRVSAK